MQLSCVVGEKKISELSPFLVFFSTSLIAQDHQLENLLVKVGGMEFSPNLWSIINQTSWAKT
jgi:hypothetical protein